MELLLDSGALAERDTFQGERCIYNALNDKIRNLLLKYDYSKSTDPLQPWAAHITSLLSRSVPKTSDIVLDETAETFELHKFILSARSPYFQKKLAEAPETTSWKLPQSIPIESYRLVLRYLYLADIPREVVDARSTSTEEEVLTGVDKISKQLEVERLWEAILSGNDRRLVRQRHQDEVNLAQQQIEGFFREEVLGHKMVLNPEKVDEVKWPHDNAMFADCLLRADEEGASQETGSLEVRQAYSGIPVGPGAKSQAENGAKKARSVLYPVHKAMLIRSPYFDTMFSSGFKEAQGSNYLHIVKVDCPPEVLEIVLGFLYTEKVECPLEYGLDLLYVSDMLLLDKLKTKAAVAISSLGSGDNNALVDRTHAQDAGKEAQVVEVEPINVYDVIHAAWDLRVQRLEEFAARYLAYRLEDYIDEEEFAELIQQSAARLKTREETDTIELLDDIRYYLSERFRLRFEDAGLDDMLDEDGEIDAEFAEALHSHAEAAGAPASSADVPASAEPASRDAAGPAVGAQERREGVMRTLDGKLAEDEFSLDAMNYQVLLEKIDNMLDKLKLDA